MIHDPDLLDRLQGHGATAFDGEVFRHMLGAYPPQRENTAGARWNPPGTAAIYTSLQRETALAEAAYRLGLQPVPIMVARTLYRIRVQLNSVVDLSVSGALAQLGVSQVELESTDLTQCQRVGGAAAFLKHDGLLVPSARAAGANLVILPTNGGHSLTFDVLASEQVT